MRQRHFALVVTLLLALAGLALAPAWPRTFVIAAQEPTPEVTEAVASGDMTEGKRQFNTWCVGCHGPGSSGPGVLAPGGPGASVTFETLLPMIRTGEGHAEPPGPYSPNELSDTQIRDVAAYVGSVAGPPSPPPDAQAASPPAHTPTSLAPVEGTGTDDQSPSNGAPPPPCFLRSWGQDPNGNGQFIPFGVAVAPDGTVYVTDPLAHRVQSFDADGTALGEWGSQGAGDGQFTAPTGVAVAPDGQTVYVVDAGNHHVQFFDPTGTFLGEWGSRGSGDGEFEGGDEPWGGLFGIAVAPDGTVYVADIGNHRIQYFDSAGSYLGQWGDQGSGDGQFDSPSGIDVAPDGTVYIVDQGNNRIQYFDATGMFLGAWGSRGTGGGSFYIPFDVAVSLDGKIVYLSDGDNHLIQGFDANGTYLGQWRHEISFPYGVAVASDGTVYVADAGNERIQYFDATGNSLVSSAGNGRPGEGPFHHPAPGQQHEPLLGFRQLDDLQLETIRRRPRAIVARVALVDEAEFDGLSGDRLDPPRRAAT